MNARPGRPYEIEARQRALKAARLAVAENLTHVEAAKRVGANAFTASEAYQVLVYGTAEEIALLEHGEISLANITRAVRARTGNQHRSRKAGTPRAMLASEIELRQAAFRAARLAIKEGLSHRDAARRENSTRSGVSDAWLILQHCSEEQIARAETGEIALFTLITWIKDNVPREVRRGGRKSPVFAADVRKERDTDSALFAKLRDALDHIASMPQPADVVKIMKKHRMREEKVNEKLIAAFAWITEFSDAWTR